jgi:hypothetical protein
MALALHALTAIEGSLADRGFPDGARLIPVRELAAVVTDRPLFAAAPPSDEQVDQHRQIVDRLFEAGPVLPAPVGVLFRSEDALTKWLGVHYVALSDALGFVEDRVAARVHVCRRTDCDPGEQVGADVASAAANVVRALRRHAVAAVPLRVEHYTGIVVSSAFLVERDLWRAFETALVDQQREHPTLAITSSGPWAPYDFVHMQFGG